MIPFFCMLLIFIIAYFTVMHITGSFVKKNEIVYPSMEQTLPCKEPVKRILYLYEPSAHGNVEKMAQWLAGKCQSKGCQVTLNRVSPDSSYALSEYDMIICSSAVYMGLPALPLQKYIEAHSFDGKQVVLLLLGKHTDVTEELELLADRITGALEICKIKAGKNEYEKAWENVSSLLAKEEKENG